MPYKDKEQQREYQRQWMAKRRADFFDGKRCSCGSKENLELDHVDPTKKVSHKIWSWSDKRRLEELAKCQVLCYECHKKKSSKDVSALLTKPIVHGNVKGYWNGCRCELCHDALVMHWRTIRA